MKVPKSESSVRIFGIIRHLDFFSLPKTNPKPKHKIKSFTTFKPHTFHNNKYTDYVYVDLSMGGDHYSKRYTKDGRKTHMHFKK